MCTSISKYIILIKKYFMIFICEILRDLLQVTNLLIMMYWSMMDGTNKLNLTTG